MSFTKSEIFQSAWCTAREMAKAAGTGPKAQFGAALKATYAMIKDMAAEQAAEKDRRIEALYEELEEMRASKSFGARASMQKDRHIARFAAIQSEIAALAA